MQRITFTNPMRFVKVNSQAMKNFWDRALGHWLPRINYFSLNEYEKACRELLKAEKLSNVRINAHRKR